MCCIHLMIGISFICGGENWANIMFDDIDLLPDFTVISNGKLLISE